MNKTKIADLRRDYARESLDEQNVASDPITQFSHWFQEAMNSACAEPNAMTLATAEQDGQPSARIVLLKGCDARGFVFFTNYRSRKGRELTLNPRAALLFHWIELERQVRVEGAVEMIPREESDEYYASRPIGSRLGAWVSPQSEVIARREELESRLAEVSAKFGDNPPRPEHWGGYLLAPDMLEFWQGRPNRLHDRVRYVRKSANAWKIERLAP
jgi:pyridoxamine 5'-phosphate oxidase